MSPRISYLSVQPLIPTNLGIINPGYPHTDQKFHETSTFLVASSDTDLGIINPGEFYFIHKLYTTKIIVQHK